MEYLEKDLDDSADKHVHFEQHVSEERSACIDKIAYVEQPMEQTVSVAPLRGALVLLDNLETVHGMTFQLQGIDDAPDMHDLFARSSDLMGRCASVLESHVQLSSMTEFEHHKEHLSMLSGEYENIAGDVRRVVAGAHLRELPPS